MYFDLLKQSVHHIDLFPYAMICNWIFKAQILESYVQNSFTFQKTDVLLGLCQKFMTEIISL